MYKLTFGTAEKFVPTKFCDKLSYKEGMLQKFDASKIEFKVTNRGCKLEFSIQFEEQVFGLGLQLKGFNHKGTKKTMRPNADPLSNSGDSHAPVPFFVTTKGYGIYVDTARYVEFYCGYGKNKERVAVANNTIITTTEELYEKSGLKENTSMVIDIPVSQDQDIARVKLEAQGILIDTLTQEQIVYMDDYLAGT